MILNMYIIVDEMGKIKRITGNNITTYVYVDDNNLIKNYSWYNIIIIGLKNIKSETNTTSKNMAKHLRRTWIVDKKVKNEADLNI